MTNRSTARGSPGAMSAGVQADRHAPKQATVTPSGTDARRRRMSVGKGRPDRLICPLGGSERSERGGTFIPAPGGRDSPAHARALPRPLVGEHGEAHVIAPAAGDLHVTPRVTL